MYALILADPVLFLSTLSLRRATPRPQPPKARVLNFYPRSPCGERRFKTQVCNFLYHFYPRSPCGERHNINGSVTTSDNFYPRSPCGERLINTYHRIFGGGISIHALLAESDDPGTSVFRGWTLFLSTLSLRRATMTHTQKFCASIFLSTLSLRRATSSSRAEAAKTSFLSTLSLRRATNSR